MDNLYIFILLKEIISVNLSVLYTYFFLQTKPYLESAHFFSLHEYKQNLMGD